MLRAAVRPMQRCNRQKFKGVGTEPILSGADALTHLTMLHATRNEHPRLSHVAHAVALQLALAVPEMPDTIVRARSGSLVAGRRHCMQLYSTHAALHAAAVAHCPVAHARSGRCYAAYEHVPHCWGASR